MNNVYIFPICLTLFLTFLLFPSNCNSKTVSGTLDCDKYCKKQPCKRYYPDKTTKDFIKCNATAPWCDTVMCLANIITQVPDDFQENGGNSNSTNNNRRISLPTWVIIYLVGGIAAMALFGKYLGFCDLCAKPNYIPYCAEDIIQGTSQLEMKKGKLNEEGAGSSSSSSAKDSGVGGDDFPDSSKENEKIMSTPNRGSPIQSDV